MGFFSIGELAHTAGLFFFLFFFNSFFFFLFFHEAFSVLRVALVFPLRNSLVKPNFPNARVRARATTYSYLLQRENHLSQGGICSLGLKPKAWACPCPTCLGSTYRPGRTDTSRAGQSRFRVNSAGDGKAMWDAGGCRCW